MSPPNNSSAAQAHLKEHGWVRVPSVLSSEEAAHALDRLWKAKATVEAEGEQTHLEFLDPNPSNIRIFYLMAVDKIFRDLITHPRAIEMVKSVLGDSFLISNFTANIAKPGSQSMALHSDQSIVFPDPWHDVWALNVIWCEQRLVFILTILRLFFSFFFFFLSFFPLPPGAWLEELNVMERTEPWCRKSCLMKSSNSLLVFSQSSTNVQFL